MKLVGKCHPEGYQYDMLGLSHVEWDKSETVEDLRTEGIHLRNITNEMTETAHVYKISELGSAKILIVGKTHAGKTSVAERLVANHFDQHKLSTVGMRFWNLKAAKLGITDSKKDWDIWLWDLGGQKEYWLLHQLFVREASLALIVIDCEKGLDELGAAIEWSRRLEKDTPRLVIGSKMDIPRSTEEKSKLKAEVLAASSASGFIETSAANNLGFEELKAQLIQQIKWDELRKNSWNSFFQKVHEELKEIAADRLPMIGIEEFRMRMQQKTGPDYDSKALDQAIQVSIQQGTLARSKRGSAGDVVVLGLGWIEKYGGSILSNAKERGLLDPFDLIRKDYQFRGIPERERLDPFYERTILECVLELMIENGICFRQSGQLIFPSLIRGIGVFESVDWLLHLSYNITGPTDCIWSSLISKAALARVFGYVRLEHNAARIDKDDDGSIELRYVDLRLESGLIDVYFSADLSLDMRRLFTIFLNDHLKNSGAIKTCLEFIKCPGDETEFSTGGTKINEARCPTCSYVVELDRGDEAKPAMGVAAKRFVELSSEIVESTEMEAMIAKRSIGKINIFVSSAKADRDKLKALARQLREEFKAGVVEIWEDSSNRDKLDSRFEEAAIILILGSPGFLNDEFCSGTILKRVIEKHESGSVSAAAVLIEPTPGWTEKVGQLELLTKNVPTDSRETARKIREFAVASLRCGKEQTVYFSKSQRKPTESPHTVRILQLGDLNLGKTMEHCLMVSNNFLHAVENNEYGLGLRKVDYLVVCGNLTADDTVEQYHLVHEFFSSLFDRLGITAQRCVLLPNRNERSQNFIRFYSQLAQKSYEFGSMRFSRDSLNFICHSEDLALAAEKGLINIVVGQDRMECPEAIQLCMYCNPRSEGDCQQSNDNQFLLEVGQLAELGKPYQLPTFNMIQINCDSGKVEVSKVAKREVSSLKKMAFEKISRF